MERLVLENLSKYLKGKCIINDLSLCIESNKVYGLIGNNGAGKTTFFRMITGLTNYSGTITIYDEQGNFSKLDRVLKRVGIVMPFPEKYDVFSINEIFEEHFFYMGVKDNLNIDKLLNYVDLNVSLETKISDLSLGMKQKLNIAIALSHNPDILLLDEPFNGLDRSGISKLKNIIKNFKKADKVVIISSHSFRELDDVIDSVIVLDNGKVISADDISFFSSKNINNIEEYFEMVKRGTCND